MKLLTAVLVSFSLLGAVACHPPASIQTAPGKTAYTADQIVLRINELQNAAIQAEASGGLTTATTRLIVQFCVSADTALKNSPNGWQPTVSAAWAELKRQVIVMPSSAFYTTWNAVDLVLAAIGV